MKKIILPTSRDVVRTIAGKFRGKHIKIQDLFAGQNLLIEDIDAYPRFKRHLGPEKMRWQCMECLEASGYEKPLNLAAYTNWSGKTEPPQKLEECRAALRGEPSTIVVETDDGISFSFALAEGCRGEMGLVRKNFKIIPADGRVSTEDTQDHGPLPFIFPDPDVVPAIFYSGGRSSHLFHGARTSGTDEFWDYVREEPCAVQFVFMGEIEISGEIIQSWRSLDFRFSRKTRSDSEQREQQFPMMVVLGDYRTGVEPLMWVDVTEKGETTRYEVGTSLKPLLLADDLSPFQ